MKIFFTITKSEAGGAQTHVLQLSKFFVQAGHEVFVMAAPGGWLEIKVQEVGAKFIPNRFFSNAVNPINCFRAVSEVKRTVKEICPDIIHTHSSGAGFYTRLAVKNKIPTIFTAHGWGFNIGAPFFQKYLAILGEMVGADFTTKIICVSNFVKDLGIKYRIAAPDKFIVIYNGVEDLPLPVESQSNDDKVKLIFVGRLAAPKLPNMFLQALSELPDEINNKIEVLIIGGGAKKEMLQNYAQEMKLNQVKMLGNRNRREIMAVLLQSDIFVLLSRYEGLPITVLEAMSASLPVLASRVGGIPEMVDESSGILVENDLEDIKAGLVKLINNKDLRKRLGVAGRKKIQDNFSLEKMCDETYKLYQEVIKL